MIHAVFHLAGKIHFLAEIIGGQVTAASVQCRIIRSVLDELPCPCVQVAIDQTVRCLQRCTSYHFSFCRPTMNTESVGALQWRIRHGSVRQCSVNHERLVMSVGYLLRRRRSWGTYRSSFRNKSIACSSRLFGSQTPVISLVSVFIVAACSCLGSFYAHALQRYSLAEVASNEVLNSR